MLYNYTIPHLGSVSYFSSSYSILSLKVNVLLLHNKNPIAKKSHWFHAIFLKLLLLLTEQIFSINNNPQIRTIIHFGKNNNSEFPVEILTRFSIDFFTKLKLFHRESNSCLWDPWNCRRSPIICIKEFQH